MGTNNDKLLKIVDSSGYQFQQAVVEKLRTLSTNRTFDGILTEHSWSHEKENLTGFIDIILMHDYVRLVIECKRSLNASWIFLLPKDKQVNTDTARLGWGFRNDSSKQTFYCYNDFNFEPKSYISNFCVIRGSDASNSSFLERLCNFLIISQDALTKEELTISTNRLPNRILTIPIIITTAQLFVCKYNISDISLVNGFTSNADFEIVPFIKFHKTLVNENLRGNIINLQESNKEKERTVFIINSECIEQFFHEWHINFQKKMPWGNETGL
jgi:hypothetical protein